MRRKFLLPALAACAVLSVGAPVASASKAHIAASNTATAIKFLLKANTHRASEIGALKDQVTGLRTAVTGIKAVLDPIVAAAPQILSGLTALKDGVTQLKDGVTALKDGLTALSTSVQGPNVAGQLGAAGTANPGTGNDATPTTLPTGTLYRQIVLSSAASGGLPAGAPVGIRLWVKMPDVSGLYSNFWACTAAHATGTAQVAGSSTYAGDVACPAAN